MRSDELEQIISKGECQTVDFKSSAILSDPFKIARIMVAFANNAHVLPPYGGLILVGVNDDGTLEGMEQKQGHEEYIMNVARDKCQPALAPKFEMVTISEKDVYVITIPKMKTYPHAVKFSDCSAYYIRVGTTVRVANPEELQELFVSSGKTTINQAIQRLRETVPSYNGPYRSVLIAPEYLINDLIKLTQKSELQIMHLFSRELTIGDPKPTQNSVIFRFPNDKVVEYFATVTKEGLIFYREYINESTGEIPGSVGVHLGRTINIIKRLIEFAAALYQSYNYNDVCLIEFEAGNIGNLPLIYSDYFHRSFYRFESGNVLNIKRQISRNDLKASNSLLESIAIELSRSFGLHMEGETAKTYIERLNR